MSYDAQRLRQQTHEGIQPTHTLSHSHSSGHFNDGVSDVAVQIVSVKKSMPPTDYFTNYTEKQPRNSTERKWVGEEGGKSLGRGL